MRRFSVLLTVGFLHIFLVSCGDKNIREVSKETAGRPVAIKVGVASVTKGKRTHKAPGTVKSLTVAPLASKIMGTVMEVRVRAGDHVRKGQLLVQLDSREPEAMVQKSEAGLQEAKLALQEIDKSLEANQLNLKLATSTLKRYEELASQKSISPQEFDEIRTRQQSAAASLEALEARKQQIEARVRQAESDVRSVQALRSYTQIVSPMDGVVMERHAEPGMLAAPGMSLLTVEDSGHYRLEVSVEESKIAGLKTGQAIPLKLDSLRPPELKGSIAEIQPSADPMSRSFLVKISFPSRRELRSGMYGEAFFDAGVTKGIWIQPGGIIRQGQLEGVYVLGKDNRIRLRLLKLGEITDHGIEVLSGLEGGETYVTQLGPDLYDGCLVEVSR